MPAKKKAQQEDNKKEKRPKGKGSGLNSMLLGVVVTLGVLVLVVVSLGAAGVHVFHHQPVRHPSLAAVVEISSIGCILRPAMHGLVSDAAAVDGGLTDA